MWDVFLARLLVRRRRFVLSKDRAPSESRRCRRAVARFGDVERDVVEASPEELPGPQQRAGGRRRARDVAAVVAGVMPPVVRRRLAGFARGRVIRAARVADVVGVAGEVGPEVHRGSTALPGKRPHGQDVSTNVRVAPGRERPRAAHAGTSRGTPSRRTLQIERLDAVAAVGVLDRAAARPLNSTVPSLRRT